MADIRWKLEGLAPVEHRVLGFDRRLLWPTVGVLLVVLLWSSIMPAIDPAVDALEIAPGTTYDMGPAKITLVPGWVLARPPSPVGESKEATIVKESIALKVKAGTSKGTATELLEQVARLQGDYVVEGRIIQIRTAQGVTGVMKKINGPNFIGLVASFVDDGGGIAVTVKGPADASEQLGQPVAERIQSIAFKRAGYVLDAAIDLAKAIASTNDPHSSEADQRARRSRGYAPCR